ncbi:hypothetical protein [Streptomyces muensis]|uniref:Uncharacterized protein n=1 Tax=Streptomyces muensis TaxID=1077944 RepID=A0A9X1TVL9_STRM4|nr:hypothetical protein [Streptomyces muensis]MCF1597523.1 hypothetical protein [Streptomyces muensis]
MKVLLLCTSCGHRLTEPLRRLPELPERPAYVGRKNPDGTRHAPSTVPRGTYAVDPEPSGAPYVPQPDYDVWLRTEGSHAYNGEQLVPAGPRDTLVVHPQDTLGRLSRRPGLRDHGCCGLPGMEGPNQLCGGCGGAVATELSECYGPYETHFLPDAVRAESA